MKKHDHQSQSKKTVKDYKLPIKVNPKKTVKDYNIPIRVIVKPPYGTPAYFKWEEEMMHEEESARILARKASRDWERYIEIRQGERVN